MKKQGKHKIWNLVFGLLAVVILLGCGQLSQPANNEPQSSLVFYNWEDDVPASVLEKFTSETGISVDYQTYESLEEVIQNMRSGKSYDVINLDHRYIPAAIERGMLNTLNPDHVPNIKSISEKFLNPPFDPGNRYSVPYNWGTTGLVVNTAKVGFEVRKWADLWDPRLEGKIAIRRTEPREIMAVALRSIGYDPNTQNPGEMEAALQKLQQLKPRIVFYEDYDVDTATSLMQNEGVTVAIGYAADGLEGAEIDPAIQYILPEDGALLWVENFVISSRTQNQEQAEQFINFLLRPDIAAEIINYNGYATPNEAAFPLIDAEILENRIIYPPDDELIDAQLILPVSRPAEDTYLVIWDRFINGD